MFCRVRSWVLSGSPDSFLMRRGSHSAEAQKGPARDYYGQVVFLKPLSSHLHWNDILNSFHKDHLQV